MPWTLCNKAVSSSWTDVILLLLLMVDLKRDKLFDLKRDKLFGRMKSFWAFWEDEKVLESR
jgi:hypothetical protein